MATHCPHCGGAIALVAVQATPPPADPLPELLEPCVIGYRLNLGEAYVRRLCRRGQAAGIAGIERRGGRWFASIQAIERARLGAF